MAKPQPKIGHRLRRLNRLKIFAKKARPYKLVIQRNKLSATSATLMASFCRGRFETCPYAGSGL